MMKPSAVQNRQSLVLIANRLEDLCDEVTFIGGSIIGFLLTDPASPDVRFTKDVDCTIDVITIPDYYKFTSKLRKKGFKELSSGEHPICRWECEGVYIDVVPCDKSILGFSNQWYADAISNASKHKIDGQRDINIISAPYFIATKLVAFKDRGKNDFLSSHDLEDIITVIDGRPEIAFEVSEADMSVRNYLLEEFELLLSNARFLQSLPGHLNYSSNSQQREQIVLQRMKAILNRPSLS